MSQIIRRVGLLAVVRELRTELRGIGATVARTRAMMWFGNGVVLLAASGIGVLPLGWLAFGLQILGYVLVALFVAWPELVARIWLDEDEFAIRERDSATVVTYLPVAIAVFTLPFYLLAQTVLFWRVMHHFPGVLGETSWNDAWRLSLDNLLFTELFLDLFDVFDLGFATEIEEFVGRALIFVTRLLLSIGVVRVMISITRAAYYRAHGLGRGTDAIGALEGAVSDRDSVRAGHLAREIARDVRGTIDILIERIRIADQAESAKACIRALRDWVIPYLRTCVTYGDARADDLKSLLQELNTPQEIYEPEAPHRRPWIAAGIALAFFGMVACIGLGQRAIAFGFGAFGMIAICGLLVQPRTTYEWGMERGLLPFVELESLRKATLTWITVLTVLFLGSSWYTLWHAASLWPGSFESSQAVVDRETMLQFIASSLVRVQLFLSIPELFAIFEPRTEQQPWIGSLLTWTLRTGLNLGFVAVVLSGLTIVRDREGMAGLVSASDDLAMRIEALRGGRYAHYILYYHDLLLGQRLWKALDAAVDADTQDALVGSGVFDWCLEYASLEEASSPERLRSQSAVIEALSREGREHPLNWARDLDAALESGNWSPVIRVQVLARRAVAAVKTQNLRDATRLLRESHSLLLDARDEMDADEYREARAVWCRSVVRVNAELPPNPIAYEAVETISEQAAEMLTELAADQPNRFVVDMLRFGLVRAAVIGRGRGAANGVAELERICQSVLALPESHPWREMLLIQALVTVPSIAGLEERELQRLDAKLLEALGRLDAVWDARELAVRAYDNRLCEELAQPVFMLTSLPPSNGAYIAAMRAAEVFRVRADFGVIEAGAYGIGCRVIAAKIAYRLEEYSDAMAAAGEALKWGDSIRGTPRADVVVATAHGLFALSARALGLEEIAREHAAQARALYDRVAASGWEGASAALEKGRVYYEGFD